jgi:hypothetical protein
MELDIINLIEKNPNIRLNKEYENKLINKIKKNFTNNDQQLFIGSFYCFLNYNSKNDFIIDFENIWKWLGFSRKDPAKRLLEKNFTNEVDFKIQKTTTINGRSVLETKESIFHQSVENKNKLETRGRREENIMLTVNAFKKFCLKANTKKADEIHDYYIKLEELLQETINEETHELKEQLYIKQNELKQKNNKITELSKYVIRKFSTKFKTGNCVYFIKSPEINDKIKIGSTVNINYRISDLSTGSPEYFEVIELFYTEFHTLLEKSIKELFGKYRISVNCEWFDISIIEKIKEFVLNQIELYNNYKKYSNNNTVSELEISNTPLYENEKECIKCKNILKHKYFFFFNKDKRMHYDICIHCYEKENGDNKKQCSRCVKIKDKIDFVIDKTKKDGLTYECKECRNEISRERSKHLKEQNQNVGKKQCTKCFELKLCKMFYTTDDNNTECFDICKECYCEENGDCKQCFTCKEVKLFKFFDKKSCSSDGFETYCKSCRKIKRDTERKDQKEKTKNINKKECVTCKEFLKFNMFFRIFKDNDTTIEYYNECMKCYKPESLQCNRCNIIKENINFSKDSSKRTGYRTICKLCTNNASQ